MYHKKRRWSVGKVGTPEELAEKLTAHTWCCCQGFELQGYLFLNDSAGEDGAQEYAIVKLCEEGFLQIESITFGWCGPERALHFIQQALSGEMELTGLARPVSPALDTDPKHRCHLCA